MGGLVVLGLQGEERSPQPARERNLPNVER